MSAKTRKLKSKQKILCNPDRFGILKARSFERMIKTFDMIRRQIPWTIACLFFILFNLSKTNAQIAPLPNQTDPDYPSEWQEIDSLENRGLYRSALNRVQALAERAAADMKPAQELKTLIYIAKYLRELEPNGDLAVIDLLQAEYEKRPFPQKQILASLLAEVYQRYLENNLWELQDRSVRSTENPDDPLESWSAERIQRRVFSLYLSSVDNPDLRDLSIDSLSVLLAPREVPTARLRPTLYDVLCHRAIDYFSNARSYLSESARTFSMSSADLFAPAGEFAVLDIVAPEELSMKYQALSLFQDLIRYRIETGDQPALIDLDLKRLEFLKAESNHPEKDQLYHRALETLADRYELQEGAGLVYLKLALWHREQAASYDPMRGDTLKNENRKAREFCQLVLREFPNSYASEKARLLLDQIEQIYLGINMEEVLLPEKNALARLQFRNTKQGYFRIIRYEHDVEEKINQLPYDERWPTILDLPVTRQWTVRLLDDGDLNRHSQETLIRPLEYGRYALIYATDEAFSQTQDQASGMINFTVSRIGFLHRQNENELQTFVLMDRVSGKPLEGVEATFFSRRYNNRRSRYETKKIGTAQSDDKGFLTMTDPGVSFSVRFEHKEDVLHFNDNYYNGERERARKPDPQTTFFLDRAIYRPGQTVYFKGILTEAGQDRGEVSIIPNRRVKVTLRDANYQEVTTQTLRTNEYGTFNGTFQAPEAGLLGMMTLQSEYNGRATFRVEEYKRPRFKVELDPLEGSYAINDQLEVEGQATAFAGNAIDGAQVRYRITRSDLEPYPWLRSYYLPPIGYQKNVEIANGTTRTDAEGRFQIDFTAIPNESLMDQEYVRFRYAVEVEVVDITGETHAANTSIVVGKTSFVARLDWPDRLDQAESTFSTIVKCRNHNGRPVPTEGSVKIFALNAPQQVFKFRYWERPDMQAYTEDEFHALFPEYAYIGEDQAENWEKGALVGEYPFAFGEDSLQIDLSDLNAGHYLVEMEATNQNGETQFFSHRFQTYHSSRQEVAPGTGFWGQLSKAWLEPGETASLILASSLKERALLMEVEREGEIIRSEWLTLENWKTIQQLIEEADRGNIHLFYTSLNDNRLVSDKHLIRVPFSNKKLNIEYLRFRDKLRPGQEEEWTLKITGPDKEKVAAEMVATLYDASLDQFVRHYWNLNLYRSSNWSRRSWRARYFGSQQSSDRSQTAWFNRNLRDRVYPQLIWFGLLQNYELQEMVVTGYAMRERSAAPMADAAPPPPPAPPGVEKGMSVEREEEMPEEDSTGTPESPGGAADTPQPLEVRRALDETVFFLPELRTDEDGNVLIKFTMKEALTSWKFLGMAHTKELEYGLTQNQVVTQKELMVLPNAPRFLREGDELVFTGKVSNLSEGSLAGEAWIEFLDAQTGQSLDQQLQLSDTKLNFELETGRSAPLSWKIQVPEGIASLITYRIMARSGNFTDGEENVLPVLSNRMLVTESMPLSVRPDQKKKADFTAFRSSQASETAKAHQFNIEFTSNPAWLALQSMPYLMEYPHECSEQLFNRYYANALATSLMQRYPGVRGVIESWEGTDAMQSALAHNEDLKGLLLTETPWVLDAQSEEKQRARLSMLFDFTKMSNEQAAALDKLASRQLPEGGFAWFSGGNANWLITNYIIAGMGHLQALGAMDPENSPTARRILEKAIAYSDQNLREYYQRLMALAKRSNIDLQETDYLSNQIIQYLYARSFFLDIDFPEELERPLALFTAQAEKFWPRKGYQQLAQLGIVGKRMKMPNMATGIYASLSERALHSEELGMYWKYQPGFYWAEAPIETQALMIEFFRLMDDQAAVEEMKIWLLKNKQTQSWETTKATSEAIYALLCSETGEADWLQTEAVEIKFPDQKRRDYKEKIEAATRQMEPGTGYFEATWGPDEIDADLARIEVKNPNKVIAWGAAYWQYFEDLDKIRHFRDTPLKLNKEIYKSVNTEQGPELVLVDKDQKLVPGDKLIVRIELEVDRDMEFIHLKDMRASGLEPINVLSQYKWTSGLGYYESTRDAATHFFMDYLPSGSYVFEYPLRVQLAGTFSNGITTIQSMYAPEFTAHSQGMELQVDPD